MTFDVLDTSQRQWPVSEGAVILLAPHTHRPLEQTFDSVVLLLANCWQRRVPSTGVCAPSVDRGHSVIAHIVSTAATVSVKPRGRHWCGG
jgi:hypothetical protein